MLRRMGIRGPRILAKRKMFPYTSLTGGHKERIDEVVAHRKRQFDTVLCSSMGAVATGILWAEFMTPETLPIPALFAASTASLLMLTGKRRPNIDYVFYSPQHRYVFIDAKKNLQFTNMPFGLKRRFLTKPYDTLGVHY